MLSPARRRFDDGTVRHTTECVTNAPAPPKKIILPAKRQQRRTAAWGNLHAAALRTYHPAGGDVGTASCMVLCPARIGRLAWRLHGMERVLRLHGETRHRQGTLQISGAQANCCAVGRHRTWQFAPARGARSLHAWGHACHGHSCTQCRLWQAGELLPLWYKRALVEVIVVIGLDGV